MTLYRFLAGAYSLVVQAGRSFFRQAGGLPTNHTGIAGMNMLNQFKAQVTQHAGGLSPEQLVRYGVRSASGECVSPSYEVFRGYVTRHSLAEFVEMAASRNAIRPGDYLGDLLRDPHQVVGTLRADSMSSAVRVPVYFFPDAGIYAAAISDTEVLDVWMSWPCYPENW